MNSLIYRKYTLGKTLDYFFWRWLLRKNGSFISSMDSYFYGPDRGFNDYDALAQNYDKSNIKPDKQYSILPTVLLFAGNLKDKSVTDLGCGAGFFTEPLLEAGARGVYGLDNSEEQLILARESQSEKIYYYKRDIFEDKLPQSDVVVAPFVSNYARTLPILKHFFNQIFQCLPISGKLVLVVDLPNGKSLRRFGAEKRFIDSKKDEGVIEIKLFSQDEYICSLEAVYYSPETIESLLKQIGFRDIQWNKPIISKEGIKTLGKDFWKDYLDDPELGYLTAYK